MLKPLFLLLFSVPLCACQDLADFSKQEAATLSPAAETAIAGDLAHVFRGIVTDKEKTLGLSAKSEDFETRMKVALESEGFTLIEPGKPSDAISNSVKTTQIPTPVKVSVFMDKSQAYARLQSGPMMLTRSFAVNENGAQPTGPVTIRREEFGS